MFYSHQLLARKAPLGQIWMAATMHAKINRRKLDKLNIINICEEILNPSVPMALRLSGILMGGVVIVYERKVKLLYEDVTRLLVEINEAWKVKSVADPTVLPKGKSQAKYAAVTLPENQAADLGEIEQSLHYTNSNTIMGFQQTAYIAMRLDNVDEPFISHNPGEKDLPQNHHQADAANITLFEHFDSYQADTSTFNRFERFDIEDDEDDQQVNFSQQEHTEIPNTLVPSPPRHEVPQQPDEILEQPPEDHPNQQSDEGRETIQAQQGQTRQGPLRRRAKKLPASVVDYEQTIIPGQTYQSWLQNTSDIVSRRGTKRKHWGTMPSMKIAKLMDLPPVGLLCGLFTNQESYYPAPLLKLWMRNTQPLQDCPSGRTSPAQPPEPSLSSPSKRPHLHDPAAFPLDDFHSGVGSQSLGVSIEKQRANVNNNGKQSEILMEQLRSNLVINETRANGTDRMPVTEANMVTPGNSGDEVRSIPSSGSGHGFVSHNSEVSSIIRANKKRILSSSKHSGSGLEPVAEENSWHHPDPNFKLSRLPETGVTPDNDLLVETGPTQTQHNPIIDQPMDQITDSIRMHLKMHFDTPGSAQTESLNQLALGMNKKRAACLFYQTCVLATRDYIKVVQRVPYGDILISRGVKM